MEFGHTPLRQFPFLPADIALDTPECIVAAILTAAVVIGNDVYASVPLALEKYREILASLRGGTA